MAIDNVCPAHSGLQESVESLERWQAAQNGSIIRLEAKVDKLLFWAMTELAAIAILFIGVFLKR